MRTGAALALALFAAPAPAREISKVEVPESVTVGGKELRLNGAGIRKKFVIEVYVGALYLAEPSSDPEAILAADAPWRVRMVFVREVDGDTILKTFREGFEANSKQQASELVPELEKLKPALPRVKQGEEIVVTYLPGAGATVAGPGGEAQVPGKPFADALLRNWLGPRPADEGLKKKLLGR